MGDKPNPGSQEAVDLGCTCPRMDNGHGRGYLGGVNDENGYTVFVMTVGCPVHDSREEYAMSETVFNPLTGREAGIEVVLQMMCSQEGCDGEPYDQMQAAAELIVKLRAENQALLEALEEVEWGRDGFYDVLYCPCCGNVRSQGHTEDCKLGNALKQARGER